MERVDRHLRCNLTPRVSTHAISHHIEAKLRHEREVVFVVVSLATHVGFASDLNTYFFGHDRLRILGANPGQHQSFAGSPWWTAAAGCCMHSSAMSAVPPGDEVEGGAGAGDHQPFDAEPAQQLSEDEAPSPAWLPVVGVSLAIALALFWSISGDGSDGAPKPSAPSKASAPVVVATVPPAPARPPGAAQPIRPNQPIRLPNQPIRLPNQPSKAGGKAKVPSAADMERIQRMIRQRREAAGLKPPPKGK